MVIFLTGGLPAGLAANLGAILAARRALLKTFRYEVLPGSGLTAELAELLIELRAARQPGADGYVRLKDLKDAICQSPALLSRRLGYLSVRKWVEAKRAGLNLAAGLHGNSQKVRITEEGVRKIEPVWRKFQALAEHLLGGASAKDLAAHYAVNKLIVEKIHGPRKFAEAAAIPDEPPSQTVRRLRRTARIPRPQSVPIAPAEPVVEDAAARFQPNPDFID